jgi:hypothetical protein
MQEMNEPFYFIFQVVLHPPWKKMNSIIGKQQINSNTPFTVEEDDGDHLLEEQMYYKKMCLTIADSLDVCWLLLLLLLVS